MNIPEFKLRELQASDGATVSKLITEFDGDLTTRFQVNPYDAIVSGTEYETTGVVVESSDFDGLIGMGTVRFGKAQFNGDVLPFALLDGLKVNKDFRGLGLGYQIANWRVQKARDLFGENCLIITGMLYDNYASHGVASKWCNEFLESASDVLIIPTRARPPATVSGIEVREIKTNEYEQFARKQNTYYNHYNLYPPASPASIAHALEVSVDGKKPYRYYVAVDKGGNLVAGAQTWARGMLKSDTINHPPPPLRMMNSLFHLMPPDFIIRDISVHGLWFEAGQFTAARYLWEMMRWLCKDQGTTLTAGFDSRDRTARVVNAKPWHQPRPKLTFALYAPTEIDRTKLLFNPGRV
jgi:GNAT superfamily N-acetyltransferase